MSHSSYLVEEFGSKEKRQKILSGEVHYELEQNLQGLRDQEEALKIQLKSLDDTVIVIFQDDYRMLTGDIPSLSICL